MAQRDEEEIRKEAIHRFLKGEKPYHIYKDLGHSKRWFFKWLERYRSGDSEWFSERSRAPAKSSNKISQELEELIVEIRTQLMRSKYSQVGANAINWELSKRGMASVPAATINRVIQRNQLIRKKERRPSKNKNYPDWGCDWPNRLHQADLVGPRFIKHHGRFYSFNLMDVYTHRVKTSPIRTKQDHQIGRALVESWKRLGVPEYLQLDNELSFRGSNRFPRSFGLVIRLCFYFRVAPIFIPVQEPWRNGEIERFQDVFDKMFFRSQFFTSFLHLCQEAETFDSYHNQNHVYSCLKGKTPNHALGDYQIEKVPEGFKIPSKQCLKKEDGEIHLVRFIRSDRVLNVFGEKFMVSPDLVYEYVVATISTEAHVIHLYHDDKWVQYFDYSIPMDLGLPMP